MNLETKIIKPKQGLLELSRQLGSVTQACKVFGYSRDSFYGMRPASPMVRRKRDFFEWEFTKKMNAVGL